MDKHDTQRKHNNDERKKTVSLAVVFSRSKRVENQMIRKELINGFYAPHKKVCKVRTFWNFVSCAQLNVFCEREKKKQNPSHSGLISFTFKSTLEFISFNNHVSDV